MKKTHKTIIILLVLIIQTISFGQIKQVKEITKSSTISKNKIDLKMLDGMTPEQQEAYLRRFSAQDQQVKTSQSLNNLWSQIPLSTNGCINGDFNQDYSGWTGIKLCHNTNGIPIEDNVAIANYSLCTNTGISTLPFSGSQSGDHYTTINSPGFDATLTSSSPPFNLSNIPPNGGSKSIRLGNNSPGYASEAIAKKFIVTNANKKFYFKYATVMDKSHSNTDGSINGTEVFFLAEAISTQNGQSIDKYVDVGNPSNPNIQSTNNGNRYFRDWNCKYLDLSGYVGQEVVVYFLNSDCSQGGHKGYTYIDDVCKSCLDNEGDIQLNLNFKTDNCIKFPKQITGNYSLPTNATNQTLKFEVYKSNQLVKTINGPSITNNSGTFSFTLQQSHFTGLNTSVGQGYDIIAVLTFSQTNMNNQSVLVTKNSSNPVNGVQDGEEDGLDNDFKFCQRIIIGGPVSQTGNSIPLDLDDLVIPNTTQNDACCPPWNEEIIKKNMKIVPAPNGGLNANYTVMFSPTQELKTQMQAYINYAHAMNSSINSIIVHWKLHKQGSSTCDGGYGPIVDTEKFTTWTAGNNGAINGGNFWTGYPLEVGVWYKIHTGIYLNDGQKFFDDDCANNDVCIRIQVQNGIKTLEVNLNGKIYKTNAKLENTTRKN